MTAQLLDGKALAEKLKQELQQKIKAQTTQGLRPPGLAVLLVGQDPASLVYVGHKRKACDQVGIYSIVHELAATISEAELLSQITMLNEDPNIHGILVQLPLPMHIDKDKILEHIDPKKDVDGFHPYNLGRLAQRRPALRPCTPKGIISLLLHHEIELTGLNAVVIGASNIVGRPMSLELLLAACTVTTCHRFTRDLSAHVAAADLLVVAVGHSNIVASHWLKPGAIVVDVGLHRDPKTHQLVGDIDFGSASLRAGWITPVPGGVGPMTVVTLMQNTYDAAYQHLYCHPAG